MNLGKKDWTAGLLIKRFEDHQKNVEEVLGDMARWTKGYGERVAEEEGKSQEEVEVLNVGKIDPRKHLEAGVEELMANNIVQCLGTMLATVVF